MLGYDLKEDEDSDWEPRAELTQVAIESESQVEIDDELKLQEEKQASIDDKTEEQPAEALVEKDAEAEKT